MALGRIDLFKLLSSMWLPPNSTWVVPFTVNSSGWKTKITRLASTCLATIDHLQLEETHPTPYSSLISDTLDRNGFGPLPVIVGLPTETYNGTCPYGHLNNPVTSLLRPPCEVPNGHSTFSIEHILHYTATWLINAGCGQVITSRLDIYPSTN